jgi:hypothetical protein
MPSLVTSDSGPKLSSLGSLPKGGISVVAPSDSATLRDSSRKRKVNFHQRHLGPTSAQSSITFSPPRKKSATTATATASSLGLQRMWKEEQLSRSSRDCQALLGTCDSTMNTNVVVRNHLWRERVAKWCYDVLDYLEESRDVAYVAMNFLDRYLAVLFKESSLLAGDIQPFEYEVMAFTSLFLAIRICGVHKQLQIPELLQLSSSRALETRHILEVGHHMLEKLTWTHRILTPHAFLKEHLGLLVVFADSNNPKQDHQNVLSREQIMSLLDFSYYLMEVSVCDSYFSTVAPSQIALGALVVAMTSDANLASHRLFLVSFLRMIEEYSSINVESEHKNLRKITSRLLDIYNQSHEATVSSSQTLQMTNNRETSCHAHTNNQSSRSTDVTSKLISTTHLIIDDDEDKEGTATKANSILATTVAEGVVALEDFRSIPPSTSSTVMQGMMRMAKLTNQQ